MFLKISLLLIFSESTVVKYKLPLLCFDCRLWLIIWFQSKMKNVEQPFYFLANAYHKLYKEKLEVMKSLA